MMANLTSKPTLFKVEKICKQIGRETYRIIYNKHIKK